MRNHDTTSASTRTKPKAPPSTKYGRRLIVYLKRIGNNTKVVVRPPAKKPHTAKSDAGCRSARPVMAWPDVQPPAYAVPNPTRNPPTTIETKPLSVTSEDHANTSCGARPLRSVNPRL